MSSIMPALPTLDAGISDYAGEVGKGTFDALVERLKPLTTGNAELSDVSKRRMEELRRELILYGLESLIQISRRDVRLIIRLIRDAPPDVPSGIELTEQRMADFDLITNGLTPSLARSWILAFFKQFDQIKGYEALAAYLQSHISYVKARRLAKDIACYQQYGDLIFSSDGPENIAAYTIKNRTTLERVLNDLSIPGGSRFFEVTTHIYYIKTLEGLKFGADDPVMAEIRTVKDARGPERLLIGQLASRLLIKRCLDEKKKIPDNWRDFVLDICGDPRVPHYSRRFTEWWAPLGSRYVEAMCRWLSELDLKLFLYVLEQVAESSGDPDMRRMFPARKQFLEGLLNAELVHHSRLILGSEARAQIERSSNHENLREFAELVERDKCLIYLDLGKANLVEGTHQFAVRLYKDINIRGLVDYSRSSFAVADFPRDEADTYVIHSKSEKPIWQHRLIEDLRDFGININPQDVLTEGDYKIYRREFGMR